VNLKTEPLEGKRHILGVVDRVGQCVSMEVRAVTDHQRNASLCRGNGSVAAGQHKHRHQQKTQHIRLQFPIGACVIDVLGDCPGAMQPASSHAHHLPRQYHACPGRCMIVFATCLWLSRKTKLTEKTKSGQTDETRSDCSGNATSQPD